MSQFSGIAYLLVELVLSVLIFLVGLTGDREKILRAL